MNLADCLKTRPQHVALLGLGGSRAMYVDEICASSCSVHFDEVWTVNFGGRIYRHDKLWLMDDMRGQATNLPEYGTMMRRHDKPIITPVVYEEFPMAVRYPIEEVLNFLKDDFLNSTVAYAVAYAMMTGVKVMSLYGCDFYYPNVTRREEGGQCCAYLLGLAKGHGMQFRLPQTSTMLSAYQAKVVDGGNGHKKVVRPLYGYIKQPHYTEDGTHVEPAHTGDTQVREGSDNEPAKVG